MKLNKTVLIANASIYLIAAVASVTTNIKSDILPTLGLTALIMGILNLIAGLILLIAKSRNAGRTAFLIGGALLVIGFGLCTLFPYKLNMM